MKGSVLKCYVTTPSIPKLYSADGWWMNMKRWCTDADGLKPTHWERPVPVSLVDHRSKMKWPRIESGLAPNCLSYGMAGLFVTRTFCFRGFIGRARGWGLRRFLITSCNFLVLHSSSCHVTSVYQSHFFFFFFFFFCICNFSMTAAFQSRQTLSK